MRDTETIDVILTYLRHLPNAIQDQVCLPPIKGVDPQENFTDAKPLEALEAFMNGPRITFFQIVAIAALIDYALENCGGDRDYDRIMQRAEETDDEHLRMEALQGPLRDRYFRQAADQWSALRDGPLSLSSLQERQLQMILAGPFA